MTTAINKYNAGIISLISAMAKLWKYSEVLQIRNRFSGFGLLFYPSFSQKLSVSVSYKVFSDMQDSTVIFCLLMTLREEKC